MGWVVSLIKKIGVFFLIKGAMGGYYYVPSYSMDVCEGTVFVVYDQWMSIHLLKKNDLHFEVVANVYL